MAVRHFKALYACGLLGEEGIGAMPLATNLIHQELLANNRPARFWGSSKILEAGIDFLGKLGPKAEPVIPHLIRKYWTIATRRFASRL